MPALSRRGGLSGCLVGTPRGEDAPDLGTVLLAVSLGPAPCVPSTPRNPYWLWIKLVLVLNSPVNVSWRLFWKGGDIIIICGILFLFFTKSLFP